MKKNVINLFSLGNKTKVMERTHIALTLSEPFFFAQHLYVWLRSVRNNWKYKQITTMKELQIQIQAHDTAAKSIASGMRQLRRPKNAVSDLPQPSSSHCFNCRIIYALKQFHGIVKIIVNNTKCNSNHTKQNYLSIEEFCVPMTISIQSVNVKSNICCTDAPILSSYTCAAALQFQGYFERAAYFEKTLAHSHTSKQWLSFNKLMITVLIYIPKGFNKFCMFLYVCGSAWSAKKCVGMLMTSTS